MNELVYATPHGVGTLEPTQAAGWADHTAALAIFGALVMNFDGASGRMGYFPWLAERVDAVDALTWEIALRPELTFHNGERLDAEALRFSFARILAPEFPSRRYFHSAPIVGLDVLSPLVLRVTTSRPIAIFPARLFRADGAPVAPRHYGAVTRSDDPVGAGPFRFVSHQPGDRLTLARFDSFADGRGLPDFERLVLRTVHDPSELLAEMAAGRIDIAPIQPDQSQAVEALAGWRVVFGPDTSRMSFEFNQSAHPALADRRVRQAINHGIDVEALRQRLTGGAGERIASLVNPPNADPEIAPYRYDPSLARALLAEAGYGQGFPIAIDWSTGPDRGVLAQAVVPYLEALGIAVTGVHERDWSSAYLPGQVAGTLAGLHGHGHAGVEMTAETDLWPLHPEREANSTNWSGPEAERFVALYQQLQQTTDPADQRQLGNALQRITHEEALSVPFWQMPRYVAVGPRVRHFRPYPGGHNEDFSSIRMAGGL